MRNKVAAALVACMSAFLLPAPGSAAPITPSSHIAVKAPAVSVSPVEQVRYRRYYRGYRYARRPYRSFRYVRPYAWPYYAYSGYYGPYYPYGYRYRWRPRVGIYLRF